MRTTYSPQQSIKTWAEDDRPREKLLLKGASALSNAEILAILLGSGSRDESAIGLARRILNESKNSLRDFSRLNTSDLMKFKGVGPSKATQVAAALELGKRIRASVPNRVQIKSSVDVHNLVSDELAALNHEVFWVLYLNNANHVLKREEVSRGGISGTVVDVRIIFKRAIDLLAVSVIFIHNHPSGNLNPSQNDKEVTKRAVEAGKFLDIRLLDHLIVSDKGYFSFADEGLLTT